MGTYTDPTRVQALCSMLPELDETTQVTLAELSDFITDAEAEIDAALVAVGFGAPATAPAAFVSWLGKLATEGAAATLLKAWFQDAQGVAGESAWAVYERRFNEGIKRLLAGSMTPSESATSTDAETPFAPEADPIFEVGKAW